MYSCCPEPRTQTGATLVVALIVVLIVVALATRMGRDFFVLERTVAVQEENSQAEQWLLGAESVAREALLLDLKSGSKSDSTLEPWAQPRELPLPEGVMKVCVSDLQSRINLNQLATAASEGLSPMQKRFIRLLQVLDIKPELTEEAALAIANAVFDWADVDGQRRSPGGAEELDYLQLGRNYRPANSGFASIKELKLVAGMTPELFAALTPFVSVWGNGQLNMNTVDAQLSSANNTNVVDEVKPVLLRTLGAREGLRPLTSEAAQQIASTRSRKGGVFDSLEPFHQLPLSLVPWELDALGVSSDYFQMTAVFQNSNQHRHRLQSVLARVKDAAGRPAVIVKSRSLDHGAIAAGADCAVAP